MGSYEGAPAGTTTAYTRSDVLSFKERATKMAGFNSVSVNNGQMIISALKNATKTEGSVSSIISFAHGGAAGIYLDKDAGFYTSDVSYKNPSSSNLDALIGATKSGDVKFAKNATWIFASCNAGNANDPSWSLGKNSIAEYTATYLGISTIGARGYVSPEIVDGKETGNLIAGNYHGVNVDKPGFIKFTPVTITTTKIIKSKISIFGIVLRDEVKEVTKRSGIKTEELGSKINPKDYVPKP